MKMSRLGINVTEDIKRKTSTVSKGNQPKWFDGAFWLKSNMLGYEDVAEWSTSKVLDFSTLDEKLYINYRLCRIVKEDGSSEDGCVSLNFLPKDYELRTFSKVFDLYNIVIPRKYSNNDKVKFVVDELQRITGLDTTNYLRNTVTLDAFILNEDRHYNNLGLLFNIKNEQYKISPIFDNGLSLLSDIVDYPLRKPTSINMNNVKARPFSTSFDKTLNILGVGFHIKEDLVRNFMEDNRETLGRVYSVLHSQLNKYKGSIVI